MTSIFTKETGRAYAMSLYQQMYDFYYPRLTDSEMPLYLQRVSAEQFARYQNSIIGIQYDHLCDTVGVGDADVFKNITSGYLDFDSFLQ